jgi:hypothetical protein
MMMVKTLGAPRSKFVLQTWFGECNQMLHCTYDNSRLGVVIDRNGGPAAATGYRDNLAVFVAKANRLPGIAARSPMRLFSAFHSLLYFENKVHANLYNVAL